MLTSTIDAYAAESFGLTFPGGDQAVVVAATPTPDLLALFQRSAVRSPGHNNSTQQPYPTEGLGSLMRRQWMNANAALVLPALLCFLLLLVFGFYLLHLSEGIVSSESEIARELLNKTLDETRTARAEAEARAGRIETTLGRVLESLIPKERLSKKEEGINTPPGSMVE